MGFLPALAMLFRGGIIRCVMILVKIGENIIGANPRRGLTE